MGGHHESPCHHADALDMLDSSILISKYQVCIQYLKGERWECAPLQVLSKYQVCIIKESEDSEEGRHQVCYKTERR